jgi:hypothetical protein
MGEEAWVECSATWRQDGAALEEDTPAAEIAVEALGRSRLARLEGGRRSGVWIIYKKFGRKWKFGSTEIYFTDLWFGQKVSELKWSISYESTKVMYKSCV